MPVSATTAIGSLFGGSSSSGVLGSLFGGSNILGGIGSAIGGLFGKNKGPKFMTQLNDQLTADRMLSARRWDDIMYNAKKHGIHPLAAIGAAPSGGNMSVHYDQGKDNSLAQLGQNLGRAAGANTPGKYEETLSRLAIDRARLENDLLRSQITNINNQPGNPPAPVGPVGQLADKVLPGSRAEMDASVPSKLPGVTDGIAQMFMRMRDNTGGIVYSLDPDVVQGEVAEAINAVMLVAPQLAIANIGEAFQKIYGMKLEEDTRKRLQKAVRKSKKRHKSSKEISYRKKYGIGR